MRGSGRTSVIYQSLSSGVHFGCPGALCNRLGQWSEHHGGMWIDYKCSWLTLGHESYHRIDWGNIDLFSDDDLYMVHLTALTGITLVAPGASILDCSFRCGHNGTLYPSSIPFIADIYKICFHVGWIYAR